MKFNSNPYKHQYGGVARDREVTAARFAQVFDTTVERVKTLDLNVKEGDRCFSRPEGTMEVLGYVHYEPIYDGAPPERRYVLTIINHWERWLGVYSQLGVVPVF